MFVRTLVTAAEPRTLSSTDDRWNPKATSPRAYVIPAWTPVTLRVRAGSAGRPAKTASETKTKPPGTSGSLAFPCKRADHLEVSCSERYPRLWPPSNGSEKFTFH